MASSFTPKFPGYAERVRASLAAQPFMRELLSAELVRVEPGAVEVALPVLNAMRQPHGNIHGIVASAVADSAAGYAAQTLLPEGFDIVTVEYKINYLSPGFGERIVAVGQVVRAGRTLSVCTADIYAQTGDERTACAHAVATMMAVAEA